MTALIAGCGGGGGGDDSSTSAAAPTQTATQVVVEASDGSFNPAQIYKDVSPGVVTIDSVFEGRHERRPRGRRLRRPGIRIRGGQGRRHRHQRPRGHQRRPPERRWDAARGQAGLRRVRGPQPSPCGDQGLRRGCRRGADQGRSGRSRPRAGGSLGSLELHGRRAGRRDRQPVRRGPVALDRRDLGDEPDGRGAHQLRHRQRDPDRRLDQPGQLGRPAARREGRGDRDQRADRVQLRQQLRRRLRDPGDLGPVTRSTS